MKNLLLNMRDELLFFCARRARVAQLWWRHERHDWYWSQGWIHDPLIRFMELRRKTFPMYYRWKQMRRHKKDMMEKFGFVPGVGHILEDCRGELHMIAAIDRDDPDMVTLDDGAGCSLWHCCSLPTLAQALEQRSPAP